MQVLLFFFFTSLVLCVRGEGEGAKFLKLTVGDCALLSL